MDSKEIKPVHPKGNQPWVFTGRTDAEAPIFWPPNVKSRLTGKDPDAGKDWGQEEKAVTKDEMLGWHHQLSGHEFEQAPGDSEGQGSLVCCSLWGHNESDPIEQLISNNKIFLKKKQLAAIVNISYVLFFYLLMFNFYFHIILILMKLSLH